MCDERSASFTAVMVAIKSDSAPDLYTSFAIAEGRQNGESVNYGSVVCVRGGRAYRGAVPALARVARPAHLLGARALALALHRTVSSPHSPQ